MVTTGQQAPDFAAPALVDGEGAMLELFRLVDAHDAVVLVFAPADFVPTCTADSLAARDAGWHRVPDLAVVGLSGDSLFSHAAYADRYDIPFPLVSDFHGSVAESYDMLAEQWEGHSHIPQRGIVVVGGDWTVEAVKRADPLEQVSPAPVERVTESLQSLGVDVETPAIEYGGVD